MWPAERLHTELHRSGLSATKSRDEIYFTIGYFGPLSPPQVVARLAGKVPRRTVYRTISTFISVGLASPLPGGLVELAPPLKPEHGYLICTNCGRRDRFWDEPIEQKILHLMARRRYTSPAYQLELSGICYLCSAQA